MNNQSHQPQLNPEDANTQQAVVDLMHKLEHLDENCYSCEEAFALLDEYVELVASEDEVEEIMPLVKGHIDRCSSCQDAFDMLLRILQSEPSDS